jgi:predicted RNA binding protein YcfA (HicA-like mRNA interferase family)
VPRLKCTFGEFLEIIKARGFVLHRQKATSHAIWRREDQQGKVWLVTVAAHSLSDEIKSGTLEAMIRQSGLPKILFRK